MKHVFLVPTDFTKVAECATNHALKLAETLNGSLILLHVVGKEKETESKKGQLDKVIEGLKKHYSFPIEGIVRVGNIFDDIGKVAGEVGAQLIIMGTHGMKGFQHITGSYALKVITNSKVPFIVVQQKNIKEGYKDIVLPMELSKETKQKISLTISMAKYFNSKVHIFSTLQSDEYLANTAKRNLAYAKTELAKNNISYEVKVAEKESGFVKQLLAFATSINADLITMLNIQEGGLAEFVVGPDEQQIITNEAQIPVMCINPTQTTKTGSVLFG